jgi:hypothetical protein
MQPTQPLPVDPSLHKRAYYVCVSAIDIYMMIGKTDQ